MKYKVIGWTDYDDDSVPDGDETWAVHMAIVDEIKRCGYKFTGYHHQERSYCVPILNDGCKYCFSQRGWGGIMAEAYGMTGPYDYAVYAFYYVDPFNKVDESKYFSFPGWLSGSGDAVDDPSLLNEEFVFEATEEVYKMAEEGKIVIDDDARLRYIGGGDTLTVVCGDKRLSRTVAGVDRKKDVTEELRTKMQIGSPEEKEKAEEAFRAAKTKLTVLLKVD